MNRNIGDIQVSMIDGLPVVTGAPEFARISYEMFQHLGVSGLDVFLANYVYSVIELHPTWAVVEFKGLK